MDAGIMKGLTVDAEDAAFADLVADQLADVERALVDTVRSGNSVIQEAARHVIAAGGKRFRPTLVVLCSHFGQRPDPVTLRRAAIVVELTHVASLYHDDVMDEAELRRGTSSANARYGNSMAILVGDYLFALASTETAALGHEFVTLQAGTFARLVQGQISETLPLPAGADPLQHYLAVVADKTGSLIATSAIFGGMVSRTDPQLLAVLHSFGEQIGVVFQLSDDLLDITSDDSGKVPGTDLREGVATLPVLLLDAWQRPADRELKELIAQGRTDQEALGRAVQALRTHPVLDQARELIIEKAEQARSSLDPLPEGPARRALARLCDEVVRRSR